MEPLLQTPAVAPGVRDPREEKMGWLARANVAPEIYPTPPDNYLPSLTRPSRDQVRAMQITHRERASHLDETGLTNATDISRIAALNPLTNDSIGLMLRRIESYLVSKARTGGASCS